MKNNVEEKYDVIIIGAGISGLVCGCYLAKAGYKTLIIEKKATVGGCCTSFISKNFLFDAFAHSFGGLRPNGTLECVLRELEIIDRIKISRHDPSDIFITPQYRISFWNDLRRTIDELKFKFPKESKNIENLMNFLAHTKGANTIRLRNLTFAQFMDEYIEDAELKAILSMPVLGNAGLPASKISAFTATKLYQEFHLDGGYYPEGGVQSLSNLLAERFQEFGGKILVSNTAKKILFSSKETIRGIQLRGGEQILSNLIVSNCDPHQTFDTFLATADFKKPKIDSMIPSSSLYSVFLGTDKNVVNEYQDLNSTVWHMLDFNIDKMYKNSSDGNFDDILWFMMYASPDKKGFAISILAPFKDDKFWTSHKTKLYEKLYLQVLNRVPNLKKINIKHKAIITPQTINKWTSNIEGAAYGWESTPSQCIVPGLTQNTSVKGLFLTGHWTTQTFGVSGVAYMGRDTAKLIGRKRIK